MAVPANRGHYAAVLLGERFMTSDSSSYVAAQTPESSEYDSNSFGYSSSQESPQINNVPILVANQPAVRMTQNDGLHAHRPLVGWYEIGEIGPV